MFSVILSSVTVWAILAIFSWWAIDRLVECYFRRALSRFLQCANLPYPLARDGVKFWVIWRNHQIHIILAPNKNFDVWKKHFKYASGRGDFEELVRQTREFFKDSTFEVVVSWVDFEG